MRNNVHIFVILCISLYVGGVNLMALNGPPITRYDPCGLAVIHFEKITNNIWEGVLHLDTFDKNENELQIEINFERQVVIYTSSQNATFSVMNNSHDLVIKTKDTSKRHLFYLYINEEGSDKIPAVKKFAVNNVTLCDDAIKGSQSVNKLNVTKADDKNYHHICGRRGLDHAELNTVRTYARSGDWPWHVAVLIKFTTYVNKYRCGGNIISSTAVLTAGHCISKNGYSLEPRRIMILAGINNLTDLIHVGRQIRNAVGVILHPAFSDSQATADLAIVKVAKFKFTEYVQPVCIWGPVYDKSKLFGKEAAVVGFGMTEDNKLSNTLRSAYVMVQNDSTCIAYSPDFYNGLLNEFTFCAGFGPTSGTNPRNGDSGGGLVVTTVQPDHKISWFLRGIVSKCGVSPGHGECDPKFDLIYTDVGPHYGWIYHNAGLEYRSNILH